MSAVFESDRGSEASPGPASRTVAIVHWNDGSDPRVRKIAGSLHVAGYDVHFVGAKLGHHPRAPQVIPGVRMHVLKRPSSRGHKARAWLAFLRHVSVTMRTIRPAVIHAVNEHTAAFVIATTRPSKRRVVCDVFDSLDLRFSSSSLVPRLVARWVCRLAYAGSERVLVTDEARKAVLRRGAGAAIVVPNYPVDPGPRLAAALPPVTGPLRLYVGGSLSRPRGLESLAQVAKSRSDICIVAAGWVYDSVAEKFVASPGVEFHGALEPMASLELAASCHAIVALYEPSNQNNRMASPNKVYDALCVGRPLLVNREIGIASWVVEEALGIAVPYGDAGALGRAVDVLRSRRPDAAATSRRLRRVFAEGYSWAVSETALLQGYNAIV